jgi:serine/threonine protein kinase
MAAALSQLHGESIAHQDVKPANVLVFEPRSSKLGDLGRASREAIGAVHDEWDCPGDARYAPPELQFGYVDPDWRKRRIGTDLYQLGSLAVFFFSGSAMFHLGMSHLAGDHRPGAWTGEYEAALPYVQQATARALSVFKSDVSRRIHNDDLTTRLVATVKQLCDPDPKRRGHPSDQIGHHDKQSLHRFVSEFDLIARRLEKTTIEELRR